MLEIEGKIRNFGREKNWTGLQEYIEELETETLENFVKNKFCHSDFESLWNYILHGFVDSFNSEKKRYRLIYCCLESFKDRDVSTSIAESIIKRICCEVTRFKAEELVSLCQLCIGYIQRETTTELCWKNLLPEVINIITTCQHVECNGNDMSGLEYKSNVINSLLFMEWSANLVIPLTSMFVEINLTKEEHLEIVKKLVKYTDKLTAQEIPTFVYQLLKLCEHQNSKPVFFCLQTYFGTRIYNSDLPTFDSDDFDFIGVAINEDIQQAESTVLYHIYQSALFGHESVKEYLNCLKILTKTPEFILHPFQLTVLMSISTVNTYKETVFMIIKQTISRYYYEMEKLRESFWLKNAITNKLDIDKVFKKITENSVNDRDIVINGLINLSFVLLGVGSLLGRESSVATVQRNLGKSILLDLVKLKMHLAPSVLHELCNHIIENNSSPQYVDCFKEFTRKFTLLILENRKFVTYLTDALLELPENVADKILDSIIPLTKVSISLRDHLILLLQKALFSRNTPTRRMSVRGFLKLLNHLRISNLTALSNVTDSQSSLSGYSVLTQLSVSRTTQGTQSNVFTDESICLEVLRILRRCLMQRAEVKRELYDGLYETVLTNPEIGGPILEVLWSHFQLYYRAGDELPPCNFNGIATVKDLDASLDEPLGKLVRIVGSIVVKVLGADPENRNAKDFATVLDSMISRMINCELIHFELDDGSYLMDILPECQKKRIVLKEAMSVYEALIGYRIALWDRNSENFATDVNGLFQGYLRLERCAKNAPKTKKDKKKKKDAKNDSGDSQATAGSQIDQAAKQLKAKSVEVPETVLDLPTIHKFLSLLHSNVEWTTPEQANILKSKHELHKNVLNSAVHLMRNLKNQRSGHRKANLTHCLNVSKVVYARCVARLDEFADFDSQAAVLAAECFNVALNFVHARPADDLKLFLQTVGDQGSQLTLNESLGPFIRKFESLFEAEFDDVADRQDVKKLKQIIISTLGVLVQQLPNETTVESNQFLEWIKDFSINRTLDNKAVTTAFVNVWFTNYIKFKGNFTIYEEIIKNLIRVFGTLDEEENDGADTFKVINEATSHSFLEQLAHIVKTILDDIDWLINRLKSEYGVLNYLGEENLERRRENLKGRERNVCCQLCLVIGLIESLCTVQIPIGTLSDAILKNSIQLYNCLNVLTKYFVTRSSKAYPAFQHAQFEKVAKFSGRQLPSSINMFILYIEQSQKEDESAQAKKRSTCDKLKSKVLKETKLLPKLVYEIEQFNKSIIQLSNKTKVDLAGRIGPGNTRDFRIKDIDTVMRYRQNESTESVNDDSRIEEEESTRDVECRESENDEERSEDGEDESDKEEERPKKRIKL